MATPNAVTTAAAGAHHARPKRRIPKTSSAPPEPVSTISMPRPLSTSPA
jgi:hypothetical protein